MIGDSHSRYIQTKLSENDLRIKKPANWRAFSFNQTATTSLPLDRRGRLAADVIGHAGHAADLVDNATGDLL